MDPKKEKKDETINEAVAATTPAADATKTTEAPAAQTAVVEEDDEVRQLREAEAEAAKEAEAAADPDAAAAAKPATTTTTTAETTTGKPAAAATPEKKPQQMVPVSALAAEREARRKAEAAANFHAGQAAALAAVAKAGTGKQSDGENADEIEPAEELVQIRSTKLENAKLFDAGKISLEECIKRNDELDERAQDLRESMRQPVSQPQPAEDLTLAERTAAIEEQNPVVKGLTEDEVDHLVGIAYQQAAREGKPIGTGPKATLDLRTRVAALATRLYGQPEAAAAPSKPASGTTQPALSPAAQARAAKLDLAASHPPDVSQMGSAATGAAPSDAETLARLEAATTEEEADAILRGAPQVVNKAMGRLGP